MNPMVFTILAWEREMEIRCQAHAYQRRDSDEFPSRSRQLRRPSRRPFFARLLGLRPQPACECS
jgi:hypothetical protein